MYQFRGELVTRKKIKLEKGKVATPYSKYGQGCVKVTKCNKNILNIEDIDETEKNGIKYSVKNGVLKLNGTTTADFYIRLVSNIRMKKGKYIHSTNYIQSGLYISFDNLGNTMLSLQNGKKITFELTKDKIYSKYFIWIDKGIVLNNVEIKLQLEHSSTENSFEQHEEQTYIMPVQQEMLENDYLDYDNEEEVHVWGKKILTGDEGWRMPSSNDTNAVFTNLSNTDFCDFKSDTDVQYCNYFKYKGIAQGFAVALNKGVGIYSFYSVNKYEYFVAPKAIASSVNEWKVWLKSQYDAGTPVIIYYKLQTPTRLKFTDEQKAVAKELNNARTYKNVTNITTDSKAILSLDYAKDQETQNQKMQNEIDEIKQLLSTTQTSAMLLDNLQKEVESEVE